MTLSHVFSSKLQLISRFQLHIMCNCIISQKVKRDCTIFVHVSYSRCSGGSVKQMGYVRTLLPKNFHTSLLVSLEQDHAFSFLFFEVGHFVFVFSSFGSLAAPNRSKFLIWSKVLSRQVDIVYACECELFTLFYLFKYEDDLS